VLLALWITLAQVTGAGWSSGRPPECGDPSGRGSNVWERSKSPQLRRYCDLVAGASSKLAGSAAMAEAALESAREADVILPGHAAPLVLEGRALLALGKLDDALRALEQGRGRDRSALDDPLALLAWARVLARTHRLPEAAEAYRALLPRAATLSAAERACASVEAGLVAMTRGRAGLDEAAASLREGLHDAQDEIQTVAALALALALDRRGDADEARAVLGERLHGDPRSAVGAPRARDVVAVSREESDALVALGLEPSDPAGARKAWERYIEEVGAAKDAPWVAHARGHLAALGAGRAPGGARAR